MADSELRQAIESAVSEVEKASETPTPAEKVEETPAPTTAPAEPPVESPPTVKEEVKDEPTTPTEAKGQKDIPPAPKPEADQAPKAWKASTRGKWATVDPEIKNEINRRESEMTRAFGENAQARETHKQFNETIRPFEARLRSTGLAPMHVIGKMLEMDHLLMTAPPHQRAALMANMIKDYGIDIRELDSALAGEQPADPVAARVESMLTQKLQPIQQFLQQQERQAQQSTTALQRDAETSIVQMEADTAKYPYFQDVRNDMADLIEINAARGVYLTPDQAYQRAVMMNPELQELEVTRRATEAQKKQAQEANSKAQRALQASSSVSSSPAGSPTPGSGSGSLRDDILAAVATVEGR